MTHQLIWKYQLETTDEQVIEIPETAEVLSAAVQLDERGAERLVLYALVQDQDTESRCPWTILIRGMGHSLPNTVHRDPEGFSMRLNYRRSGYSGEGFLGTHLMMGGRLVWHVWAFPGRVGR